MHAKSHPATASGKFWGTVVRKERWGLSWRGWLVLAAAVLALFLTGLFRIYGFLSENQRVDAKVLVVEGWIHEYAIRKGVEEFRSGSYEKVLTTGGPIQGTGVYINDFNTSASVGADLLKKFGMPERSLQMVPSRVMVRDRTYGSAIALRNWLRQHDSSIRKINVLTEDVHARRTRLLFKKALGKEFTVGIIGVANPDYDPKHWWRYSEGVKEVFSETMALIYAEFFFHPGAGGQRSEDGDQRSEGFL